MTLWSKLNYLLPNPDCDTVGNLVTEWRDSRPYPSQAELDAVRASDILNRAKEDEIEGDSYPEFNKQMAKLSFIMFNQIRVLEGKPEVSRRAFREAVKAL